MGQYYTPVIIKDKEIKTYRCYDFDNGAKLMEHSYIGNTFAESVVRELYHNKSRIAWVGDYADDSDTKPNGCDPFIKAENKSEAYLKVPQKINHWENSMFICYVNHTKKEWFIPCECVTPTEWGNFIHPLPLLTAIGNGMGGGDYHGTCMERVGSWACDEIELTEWNDSLKQYKDISNEIKFKEGR